MKFIVVLFFAFLTSCTKNSSVVEHYPDGKIKSKGTRRGDAKVGTWEYFKEDGTIDFVERYENDLRVSKMQPTTDGFSMDLYDSLDLTCMRSYTIREGDTMLSIEHYPRDSMVYYSYDDVNKMVGTRIQYFGTRKYETKELEFQNDKIVKSQIRKYAADSTVVVWTCTYSDVAVCDTAVYDAKTWNKVGK